MSRCVCKSWLAIVDAHRLLWADLLPLLFSGFFMNFHDFYISEFFTPRSDVPSIPGKQDYLPKASSLSWGYIDGHCNGLVLVDSYDDNGDKNRYVLNPATQWLAPLPPCPPSPMEIKGTFKVEYLAYNPTKSTNFEFEVVSVTHFGRMCKPGDTHDHEIEQCEWPPSVCILDVFSSTTGQWEERISLSSDKYHVIKPPPGIEVEDYPEIYLGKSSKGIYCASIKGRCRVQVWNLDESGCQMKWVLIHDRDLSKWLLKHKLEYPIPCYGAKIQEHWALQDINYYYDGYNSDHDMEAPTEDKIEWSLQASEDEKFTWSSYDEYGCYGGYMEILGFHPWKEIIFLSESITRGLAYHLSSSKVEVVGNIYPVGYANELGNEQILKSSFPHTPCWLTQTADERS
ncbi:unnamed protein product [Miscanthus lutarioriparius]|uniref:Uncharacterized protein n=1 Tax=Miscanthus lutarioriparius TaxID=422564 RepID=A0A811MXA2_9POAL|nr:unnamed protein product [Miscanthus lutarioriparius]